MDREFAYEQKVFDKKNIEIDQALISEKEQMKKLPSKYKNDPVMLKYMLETSMLKAYNIESNKDKPYFARLDIKEAEITEIEPLYIGKIGIIGDDGKSIVTDWRTPVASVYYDGNLGQVEYNAPGGKYKVDLLLKRQIQIENGKLKSIYDVDSVSDDELLKPYLSASMDGRLKNIIATIQKEQNDIIRENINTNMIIQGVAGSGKTTVALHRIAYLIYNYSNRMENGNFLVIGPNKIFIKYISSVLPDLDVGGVKQTTINEFLLDYIGTNIEIKESNAKLEDLVSKGIDLDKTAKYKGSMEYKEKIDEYIDEYERQYVLPKNNLKIYGVDILSKEKICKAYNSTPKDKSIEEKIEFATIYLAKQISNDEENIYSILWGKLADDLKVVTDLDEKEKIKKLMFKIKEKIKQGFKGEIKKMFYNPKGKSVELYNTFLSIYNHDDLDEICFKPSNKKNKIFEVEDIPALLYIEYRLKGAEKFKNIKATVIDEAQDLSEFAFYIIDKILFNSNITIFGDLAQSIYSYRSIDNWTQVNRLLKNKYIIKQLNKSYRNTIEIMNEANKIIETLGYSKAVPVIRNGDNVRYLKSDDITNTIINLCNDYRNQGYNSVAIITKDTKKANDIYNKLKQNIEVDLVVENNDIKKHNIKIIPSHLSKGLEFDAVIVIDDFIRNNILDMKLLYVSMTRAMHKLDVIYYG